METGWHPVAQALGHGWVGLPHLGAAGSPDTVSRIHDPTCAAFPGPLGRMTTTGSFRPPRFILCVRS